MKAFGQKYLVTGASGLLGAMACEELSRRHEVVGVYHRHPVLVPRTRLVNLDLLKTQDLAELLRAEKPNVLFHAAALVDVEYCEAHPDECVAVNQTLVGDIARLCRELNIKLVSLSTDAFFDLPPGQRATEETAPNLFSVYGRAKFESEKEAMAHAPDALVVRTNLYGWNATDKFSLAEWILDGLRHGQKLTMFRDVTYTPLLATTVVRGIEALVGAGERGVFHLGARDALTKLEFGHQVAREFGLSGSHLLSTSVKDKKFRAPRSSNMALDSTKFQKRFPGILPTVAEDLITFRRQLLSGMVDQLKNCRYLPELRGKNA